MLVIFWKLIISVLIITWIIIWTIKKTLKICRVYKLISKIPGPATIFPFGNVKPFMNVPCQKYDLLIRDICTSQGPDAQLMRVWISALPAVFIVKAEAAEVLLKNNFEITKSDQYNVLKPWLGEGIVTGTGKHWHSRRKMLTPSFHFKILNNFVPGFNEQSHILVKKLKERHQQVDGGYFDIFPFIVLCALDILCDSAMGVNLGTQNQSNLEYATALNRFADVINEITVRPWTELPIINLLSKNQREARKCIKIMKKFTEKVIIEKKKERKSSLTDKTPKAEENEFGIKTRKAFLDTLLDAIDQGEGHLTDKELREEVDTLMVAGHETSATGISWTVYYLGRNPDAQLKVQQELDRVLGRSSGEDITVQDLPKLKYLEAVIKESLRLMPPVSIYGRQLENDLDINGCVVPAGVTAFVMAYFVHRDPRFFPEPEKFIPERHLGANTEKHPFQFLSFSAGPRNCLGQKFAMMEEKIVLANIFRNFDVKSRDEIDDIDVNYAFISRPLSGHYVQLKKRHFD